MEAKAFWVLTQFPMNYEGFHSGRQEQKLSLILLELWKFLYFFWLILSPAWVVSSHLCVDQYWGAQTRGGPSVTPQLSLSVKLSTFLYSVRGAYCLLAPYSPFKEPNKLYLGFSSQCHAWKFSPGNKLGQKAHLICILTLRDHCPSLPDAQRLKNNCFIYFCPLLLLFQVEE